MHYSDLTVLLELMTCIPPSSYRVKKAQNCLFTCKQVAHLVTHYVQILLKIFLYII